MKKASFTLFQPQRWMSKLGLSALAVLFVMCMGLQTASAQKAVLMPSDSTSIADTLTACSTTGEVTSSSPVVFTDDGSTDGLYADDNVRADTTTFCPTNQWSRVKVVFTDFDVARGDTLYSFQGNVAALNNSTLAAAIKKGILPDTADLADLKILLSLQGSEAKVDSATLRGAIKIGLLPSGADTLPHAFDALKLLISLQGNPVIGPLRSDTVDAFRQAAMLGLILTPPGDTSATATVIGPTTQDTLQVFTEYLECGTNSGTRLLRGLFGSGAASQGTGSGSGIGSSSLASARTVSDAFGGWIDANCNPAVNPSGCLTFVFNTNGDRAKGTGWEAWVDCEARDVEIMNRPIADVDLSCVGLAGGAVSIPYPQVSACGEAIASTESDTVRIIITNQQGDTCVNQLGSFNGLLGVRDTVFFTPMPGLYNVEYTLLADPSPEKTKNDRFAAQLPNLVCNDNLNIPFGSACAIEILPDFLLEDPCTDSISFLYYNITVFLGSKELKTKVTFNGDTKILAEVRDGANYTVDYPSVTKDDLRAAEISTCDNSIRVRIERVNNYYTEIYKGSASLGGTGNCPPSVIRTSCESIFNIFDQSGPIFTSRIEPDTIHACDTVGLAALLDYPDVIDNCDSTVTFDVSYTGLPEGTCFDTARVKVTYVAIDACMNRSLPATQDIMIVRPTTFVNAASDTLECRSTDDSNFKPGLVVGRWQADTLAPTDTIELFEDRYVCGYILSHRDVEVPSPTCGKKVFRSWSTLDWCAPESGPSPINTQFILYTDTQAPTFEADTNSTIATAIWITLDPFECETATIPAVPTATDACTKATVRAFATERYVDSVWVAYEGTTFPCDTFRIRYAAADDCSEQPLEDTTATVFIVEDVTPPSAICTDELIVSIGSGAVRITGADLNAGSYDACDDTLDLRVRIKGTTEWLDEVALTCDHKPFVEVELQVTADKGDPVTCWSKITVEDKIRPFCTVLPDASRDCTDFHPDQYGSTGPLADGDIVTEFYNTNFGNPFDGCNDNCGLNVYNQSIVVTKGDCGAITVVRSYSVGDWNPQPLSSPVYTQTITVNPVNDFKLTFPADQEIRCGDENQDAIAEWTLDQILTENNGCDVFALDVTEKEFTVDGDFCKKIERTYEVINWCTYVAGSPAQVVPHVATGGAMVLNNDTITATSGRFVYTQIIKYSVDQAPEVTITAPDMCIYGDRDGIFNSGDECEDIKTFSAAAENCLGVALTDFRYNLTVTDADGVARLVHDNVAGNTFDVVVVPGSTYDVEFWGFDDCGNSDGATGSYTFMDCKRPTPYVLNGLAVEIMQTGEIQVWASDLDRGSFDNCTGTRELRTRIALGTPDEGPDKDAPASEILALGTQITFNCDLLGTTQFVSFYVVDEKGNWDVVGTYVFVQDNLGVCDVDPMSGTVAGKVTNAFGENVELVNVTVNGGDNSMATSATGEFAFNLPLTGDYTITPEKNINPLNGVSTFDLVLISKHILGLQKFDSPYKYIAADVNKSGSITAFDMVQLRQLILNVTSEFTNNTSWRFVDAKHEFTSENPAAENFDEFMSINNLDGSMLDVDFIAAKIGDVNGTATANSLLGAEARTINGTLNLNVTDQLVEAGQTVTVDFTSADIASAQGYQFTMDFAGLNLVELKEGVAKAANFNTNIAERSVLTTSWNGEATANDVLFSLTFTAATNGLLSELIAVNSDLTTAEAYNNAGELMNVALDFTTNVTAAFGLNQNTPNPFNGETVIGFNLPKAGAATLKVMDVQGKVLTVIERDGVKGYNQVTVNAKALSATGVLYYQLESADNIATKKMIIIE